MVYGESRRVDLVVPHDLTAPVAPVSLEAVLARDPQAIVTGADSGAASHLREWRRWPQISAVKTGSLFSIPGDFLARATPRILQDGQQLCENLEMARSRLAGY